MSGFDNLKGGKVIAAAALAVFLAVLVTAGFYGWPAEGVSANETEIKEEIQEINTEMQKKKNEMQELDTRIERFKELISSKKLESASLQDEVSLLDSMIAKAEVSVEIAEKEIEALEMALSSLDAKISEKEAEMSRERLLLGTLARRLQRQQSNRSLLEIMLSHGTFSEFFDEIYATASLQRNLDVSLRRVQQMKSDLENERHAREARRDEVNERKLIMEAEMRKLDDSKSLKENILVETRASELEYRYMLGELKREQDEADSEIANLEKTLREKMDLSERMRNQTITVLSWPVEPARGLSASFHDPEYPYRHIFEHPGVDIRAYQGTPVRAAAAGVVGRAKNAGLGYSYVMLLHNSDISTVYGHLTRITVKEDSFVERGEVIGYSGGMPGTSGAGKLTTGPHLHFETRLRGIPADPLQYLIGR